MSNTTLSSNANQSFDYDCPDFPLFSTTCQTSTSAPSYMNCPVDKNYQDDSCSKKITEAELYEEMEREYEETINSLRFQYY